MQNILSHPITAEAYHKMAEVGILPDKISEIYTPLTLPDSPIDLSALFS